MLVLTRKVGEKILIGNDIVVTVCRADLGKIQIGIEAPKTIKILRPEHLKRKSDDHAGLDNFGNALPFSPKIWEESA